MARLDNPIIIIGAGRSGTSLVNAILGSHPQIHMLGEMNFAVPALWQSFWQSAATTRERQARPSTARCAPWGSQQPNNVRALEEERESGARDRIASMVRETLARVYSLTETAKSWWGFKEIWMSSQSPHDWQAYDAVFPTALYVHVIRHPFDFARSVADYTQKPLTLPLLEENLRGWVDYVRGNCVRAETGRYLAFTYEALVADCQKTLAPLWARLNLAWDETCRSALYRRWEVSPRRNTFPSRASKLVPRVPGLECLMAELGYDIGNHGGGLGDLATRLSRHRWRLNPPFAREGAHGWIAELESSAELACLTPLADTLVHPRRSPVCLFEDGAPLGPAHSLHASIRASGSGAYSHWRNGHCLHFSTSDNSDPNCNGRIYTIALNTSVAGSIIRHFSDCIAYLGRQATGAAAGSLFRARSV
jgi:hypothetical protein